MPTVWEAIKLVKANLEKCGFTGTVIQGDALRFLDGNYQEVEDVVEQKMLAASEELDFEAAAGYRELLFGVRKLRESQKITETRIRARNRITRPLKRNDRSIPGRRSIRRKMMISPVLTARRFKVQLFFISGSVHSKAANPTSVMTNISNNTSAMSIPAFPVVCVTVSAEELFQCASRGAVPA